MGWILVGFLIEFFDFHIGGMELLPDFIGCALIVVGCGHLSGRSRHFATARLWAIGLTIVQALYFFGAISLFGALSSGAGFGFWWLIYLAVALANVYMEYRIICGVADIEEQTGLPLGTGRLLKVWLLSMVLMLTCGYILFVPLLIWVMLAVRAVYLFWFYQAWRVYSQSTPDIV